MREIKHTLDAAGMRFSAENGSLQRVNSLLMSAIFAIYFYSLFLSFGIIVTLSSF